MQTNSRSVISIRLVWAGLMGLFLFVQAAQAQSLTWLGTLGGDWSEAYGVSSDGSVVVGWARNASGFERAFRWTGGMQDLGTLGGDRSEAYGVSADGSVVVGWAKNASGYERAFRWTASGGMQDLGTLGGSGSRANGVSADGSVVVGYAWNPSNQIRAFRWTASGGMQDLGTLGGDWSLAWGVSSDGSVVVGYAPTASGQWHAFRWTASGGMQDLGTLGGDHSRAYGVSADGSVVVGVATNASGQARAFRWTASGGMQDLGTLGGDWSWAWGVSSDGSVVVGLAENASGDFRAFRWTASGGMEDLNQTYAHLLTNGSYLAEALGIFPDGRFIIGQGYNAATGRGEAFLLDTQGCAPVIAWDGGGDGTSFSDSLNWVGDRVPGQGDIARFDATAGAPAVQLSGDVLNTGLTVEDLVQLDLQGHVYGLSGDCGTPLQVNGSAQLTLEDGTLRTLIGEVQIGPTAAPELLLRDGGIVDIFTFGTLRVAAGDTAQVTVLPGGGLQLPDNTLVVGDSTYPGRLLVQSTPGAIVVRAKRLLVGQGNDGIVRIEGGDISTEILQMGELIGSEGWLTVFGGGSGLIVTDRAEIGIRGTGTLTVHSFGRIGLPASEEWVLGVEPTGEGTLELIGQSRLASALGPLVVGDRGQGHLAVLDSSRAEDLGLVWVGRQPGSAGSITVGAGYSGGSPSRMTVDGMCVGCGGVGVVGVDSVSLLQVNRLQVGPLGVVRGPVLVLTTITPPGAPRLAEVTTDSVGIWTGQLILQDSAVVEVDSVVFMPGGQLGGNGVFPFDLVNRGIVAPGDSVGQTDTLTVQGNYTQTVEGILEVELGSPSDLLQVLGDAHFDGTLRIGLAEGFMPQVGDSFVVVTYGGTGSGVFAQVEFSGGIDGMVGYSSGQVQVVVTSVTGIERDEAIIPTAFLLHQNYPNPFNPTTTIAFDLPRQAQVQLTVYDLLGREVKRLVEAALAPGRYEVVWEGRDAAGQPVASGVYLYRLIVGQASRPSFTETRKMVLMR